jgi:hypothetical protein
MAIQKAVRILIWAISDGTSTSFTFDLTKDPYWVGAATSSGQGGRVTNWPADPGEAATTPTGVMLINGATSATISNTVVTVTVPVKPAKFLYAVTMDILF